MQVVSLINPWRGGTGRTTIAINFAGLLASVGYRVLLVDADVQHHVSWHFEISPEPALWEWLVLDRFMPVSVRPTLDVLPNARLDTRWKCIPDIVLRRLSRLSAYDYVVVDVGRDGSVWEDSWAEASSSVLVPVDMSLSLATVVARELADIADNRYAVIPTKYDCRTSLGGEVLQRLLDRLPPQQVSPPIRIAVDLERAAAKGIGLHEYAASAPAVVDFWALVEWQIARTSG